MAVRNHDYIRLSDYCTESGSKHRRTKKPKSTAMPASKATSAHQTTIILYGRDDKMKLFGYEITVKKAMTADDYLRKQLSEAIYLDKPLTGAQIVEIRESFQKLYTGPNPSKDYRNNAISCIQEVIR